MNQLTARIEQIDVEGHIALVRMVCGGDPFSALVIETSSTCPGLRVGGGVRMLFKETEVSLAKDFTGHLSLRNRLCSTVRLIEKGQVLARVVLDYQGQTVVSVITSRAVEEIGLAVGDAVTGLVKANEITLGWDLTDA